MIKNCVSASGKQKLCGLLSRRVLCSLFSNLRHSLFGGLTAGERRGSCYIINNIKLDFRSNWRPQQLHAAVVGLG